jgi:hypothetical protein
MLACFQCLRVRNTIENPDDPATRQNPVFPSTPGNPYHQYIQMGTIREDNVVIVAEIVSNVQNQNRVMINPSQQTPTQHPALNTQRIEPTLSSPQNYVRRMVDRYESYRSNNS